MGGPQATKISSKIDVKIGIEKSGLCEGPIGKRCAGVVTRMGVTGTVNLRPGGRRFGRKKEKKKGRKKEKKIGRFEDLKI